MDPQAAHSAPIESESMREAPWFNWRELVRVEEVPGEFYVECDPDGFRLSLTVTQADELGPEGWIAALHWFRRHGEDFMEARCMLGFIEHAGCVPRPIRNDTLSLIVRCRALPMSRREIALAELAARYAGESPP